MKALIFVVIASSLAGCSDSVTTTYATRADAATDGAIDRGWVPEFLPGDATEIHESHSVDVGQVVVTFKSSQSDFLAALRSVGDARNHEAQDALGSVNFPGADLSGKERYYYNCTPNGAGLLARNDQTNRHFYFEPVKGETWESLCAQDGHQRSTP